LHLLGGLGYFKADALDGSNLWAHKAVARINQMCWLGYEICCLGLIRSALWLA
jgi:hypothetical protein